jgi:hypothetical protein
MRVPNSFWSVRASIPKRSSRSSSKVSIRPTSSVSCVIERSRHPVEPLLQAKGVGGLSLEERLDRSKGIFRSRGRGNNRHGDLFRKGIHASESADEGDGPRSIRQIDP